MKVNIREAATNDARALTNLLMQLGYTAFESDVVQRIQAHHQPGYKIFVAETDGHIVGFIALHIAFMLHHTKPIARITSFCVDESLRGVGVGSALLARAESYFRQTDCIKVEVTSNNRREATHQYYLQRGYSQTSQHFVKLLD